MKHGLIAIAGVVTIAAAIGQAGAQLPAPALQQAWAPPVAYRQAVPPAVYPLNAPTPHDAYRQGLINRWEFEGLEGPLPQALQGPPVDSDRGDSDGGGRN